ncbi:MAG: hypothetical protein RR115_00745 [Hydrogenoanaerobacterium sp.]
MLSEFVVAVAASPNFEVNSSKAASTILSPCFGRILRRTRDIVK